MRIFVRGDTKIKLIPNGLVWEKVIENKGKTTKKTFSITNFIPEIKRLVAAGYKEI